MKPFSQALADIMRERGLQQMDVAVRGRVSESSVHHYLKGTRRASPGAIARIAVGLDLPPEYFLEYRHWRARRMVEAALNEDVVDLADLERFLKLERAAREAGA